MVLWQTQVTHLVVVLLRKLFVADRAKLKGGIFHHLLLVVLYEHRQDRPSGRGGSHLYPVVFLDYLQC